VPLGEHVSTTEAETVALGRLVGAALDEGDWVLLSGPLGAGKTAFVRGLAEGLGIDPRLIHSPTFTFVTEHPGSRPLAHVDLYRIENVRELEELGLEEFRERKVVVAVEWGERVPPGFREGSILVRFEVVSAEARRIVISRG